MKTTHNYEFIEGIGGGGKESFLLMLNGGICKSYPCDNYNKWEALEMACQEVYISKAMFGNKKVSFKTEIGSLILTA